ncbi:MAG: alanine racemase [Patescibacteria group bacterium]|jgi:alanine racemase
MIRKDLSWIEVSQKALSQNIRILKSTLGSKTKLSVSVKANAYGHGIVETSRIFLRNGADGLCVNSFEELLKLKNESIKCPILIIGYVPPRQIKQAIKLKADLFGFNYDYLKIISSEAKKIKKHASIYLKIDTGMSRQGILADQISDLIKKIKKLPYLNITGLSTHFATADGKINNKEFLKQLNSFQKSAEIVQASYNSVILCCANSAASLTYPQARLDMARIGISAYGYYPSIETKKIWKGKPLIPALSFKTIVTQIKDIPVDSLVGYGGTFKAKKQMRVAILPVGYYDGLDRKLSNKGEILVDGKKAKIIGRICMNLTIVDITAIDGVKIGDEAVIIGRQGKEQITADDLAKQIGTINYEVLARLRENLNKYYL